MEQYFQVIISSLTIEDISLLNTLLNSDATAKVKAIKNSNLFKEANISEAIYRKVMLRLITLKFIEANTDFKEHTFYITKHGIDALHLSVETMKGSDEE